jgi:4-amino-4-deoxy-L-arabinose transferase-like glycosyltransferase
MDLALPKKHTPKSTPDRQSPARIKYLLTRLFSWEIYLILLIAGFLHLYRLNTSEFDGDQAVIFGLAREAVHFGLLPIVSNQASIGTEHPPALIYLLIIPAILSADPLWAVVTVGLFNILAVLLTYFFTRRYYGRLAGIIAALLYTAAAKPLNYSRFIWQPNMLAPFIMLFMFALFWGAVERRRGWFFPAVLLLGVIYQLHEISAVLVILLLVTLVLAPGTVRWRDLFLAFISLLVIFFPYILWEYSSKFADVHVVLNIAKLRAHIDSDAIYFYKFFLSPNGFGSYYQVPADPTSILRLFGPILFLLRYTLWLLVAGGLVIAGGLVLWSRTGGQGDRFAPLSLLRTWWTDFRATPSRCGLALLLVWQVVPILLLSRHSLPLYLHYLLMLMPGPFILAGIFISQVVKWTSRRRWYWSGLRYSMFAIAAFAVIAQLVTCTATLIDFTDGTYKHSQNFNDLGSLQYALSQADQLALHHHLNRVYITTDRNTQSSLHYLSQQMQTPTTLFDDSRCLVLPNLSAGPAVLLVSPYAQLTLALLREYATATLVDQPARLGAPPFQLYIVASRRATEQPSTSETFIGNLKLINAQRQHLNLADPIWLVSRWNLLRSAHSSASTSYNYAMTAFTNTNNYPRRSLCTFTAMRPGDQLFVAFALPGNLSMPALVTIQGQFYTITPYNPSFGPLRLETDQTQDSLIILLRTMQGKNRITTLLE